MNNISKINLYGMQNSEFLGLMLKLQIFAKKLTAAEILPSVAAFNSEVAVLEKHLAENYGETVNKTAQRINDERLAAYNALRYCVKGLSMSLNDQVATVGAKYWNIVETTEDPRRANQDAVTKALAALITAFHEFDAEELKTYGVDDFLTLLETRQAEYIAAAENRGHEANDRIDKATFKYRKNCYYSFYALAYHAVARATNNADQECIDFVKNANGELDLRKRQLKLRRTLANKAAETAKSETTASVTDQSASVANTIAIADSSETTTNVPDGAATVAETEQVETEKAVA